MHKEISFPAVPPGLKSISLQEEESFYSLFRLAHKMKKTPQINLRCIFIRLMKFIQQFLGVFFLRNWKINTSIIISVF